MKRNNQRWGPHFWGVVTVGALLVGGMAAVDRADAIELTSGLLRSADATHCSAVNASTQAIPNVLVRIRHGSDGSDCASFTFASIAAGTARGVTCSAPNRGTYCQVSGGFSSTRVRAEFTSRDSGIGGEERASTDVR